MILVFYRHTEKLYIVSECVYAHNAMSTEINLESHLSGSKQGYLSDYRQGYLKWRYKKHQPPTPGGKKGK